MGKCVLTLPSKKAKEFFLKSDSYITLELPEYFTFGEVLEEVSKKFGFSILTKREILDAKKSNKVNHTIIANKDGKYAWRKFSLINPLIYASLVNVITEVNNWKIIVKRINHLCVNKSIRCLSYPVIPGNNRTQKASQIGEWINNVEKESIRLALDFEYVYQTDISNCYGSMYTHSLAWAIHGKKFSKVHRGIDDCLGNLIDNHIQAMTNGQTNGIPQGSLLMDFLAEIILAYSDSLVTKELKGKLKKHDYKILRYRDDYRIFVRSQKDADLIIKALSEVLSSLGLQLNTSKTFNSDELIISSIKPDKIATMQISIGNNLSKSQLRNDLLLIYKTGNMFPNCGSIKTMLINLYKKYESANIDYFRHQEKELVSILTNVGRQNPSSFPIVAAFISRIIKNLSSSGKSNILNMVSKKLGVLPNSGLLEIWMQRISMPNNIGLPFKEKVCKKIDNSTIKLFDMDWSSNIAIKNFVDHSTMFDSQKIASIDNVITSKEIDLFKDYYDGSR